MMDLLAIRVCFISIIQLIAYFRSTGSCRVNSLLSLSTKFNEFRPAGQEGQPGIQGAMGRPGEDANYCPCPARNSGGGKPTDNYASVNSYPSGPQKNSYSQGSVNQGTPHL